MEETQPVTAVAINKDKHCQVVVRWAVDNLLYNGCQCFLIHVRSQSLHPQDSKAAPSEGRSPTEAELEQLFLPYRAYCARKGVQPNEVVLDSNDVAGALVDFIQNNNIGIIVIGASSRNVLTSWTSRHSDVPTRLLKSAPESCSVYVISKGKVQNSRIVKSPVSPIDNAALHRSPYLKALLSKISYEGPKIEILSRTVSNGLHFRSKSVRPSSSFMNDSFKVTLPEKVKIKDEVKASTPSTGIQRLNYDGVSNSINGSFKVTPHDQMKTKDEVKSCTPSTGSQTPESPQRISTSETLTGPSSCRSTDISGHNSDNDSIPFSSLTPRDLKDEMRKLREELKKSVEMYRSVTKEALVAKEEARMLQQWRAEEERKIEEARLSQEVALAMAEAERQQTKAAMETAQMAQLLADIEARTTKIAELKAKRAEEAKEKALDQLANNKPVYRKYIIDDIEVATDHFNVSQKIGEGGYGPVFKGTLDHTDVAIKILRPDISQGQNQFQKEVEILSCMRHPHLVILIGACPDNGCLVYEYMENGSLEDRLFRKDNTPSIPWRIRFRIAAEIATGLLFLHQTRPEPLVHRDLKPANILLDRNYVSKISDVGLARLVPPSYKDSVSQYHLTVARGTFCYIDPEYQQTGLLGVKSDVYSLGVVLLQLITSRPPMGLTVQVEEAIDNGTFADMLDPTVPDWPVEEALSLAKLALQCCELRKRDRPDLASVVLPELNHLRDLGL